MTIETASIPFPEHRRRWVARARVVLRELADVYELIVLRQLQRREGIVEVVRHVGRVHAALTGEKRQVLHRRSGTQSQCEHQREQHVNASRSPRTLPHRSHDP